MKTYEETLDFLGQWGRFQSLIFFLLCVSAMPNGLYVFSIVFVGASPSHHCLVPDVNHTQAWGSATIPTEVVDGTLQLCRCSRFRLDVVTNLSAQGLIPTRDINLTEVEQEGCVDGWKYSTDTYQSTIVSEFDLVCSEQWKQPFTSTIFFLGVLFGSFISGQISDRFGRKPVFIVFTATQLISTFVQIFSPTWMVFCVLYFIIGFSQTSNYVAAFVLGTEILNGKVRVMFSSFGMCFGFAVGYMLLPLFAYFLRDWKSLLIAINVPSLIYIPIWWFIPESPRWLLSVGKVEEAEAIVRRIAKFNNIQAPQVIFEDTSLQSNEIKTLPKKYHSILHLVKTRNIRLTTIILCLVWSSTRIGYYGLALNTSQLHADPYLSCFLSAVVEVPAYVSTWLALIYLPRRLTIVSILLTEALSLFFIQLVPQSLYHIAVALEMLGKFAITVGAALMYVYIAELYPTVIRSTGAGTCSTIARVGSCMAPFLLSLRLYFLYLPYIIIGTLAVVSAFTVLFLPETFRRPLPQTLQDMPKRGSVKCPFITPKEPSAPAVGFDSGL